MGSIDETTDLLFFERQAKGLGYHLVAGVDEVGRGPLAGPVVAAAVIVPDGDFSIPVKDSKALSATRRQVLSDRLRTHPGVCISIAAVEPAEIDEINILQATHKAMRCALAQLLPQADFALVDGLPVPRLPIPAEFLVKGDSRSASIAAASIVAKVHRDALMVELDTAFPGYGFSRHKGYGTREHLDALRRLGPCPAHRRSFAPVAKAVNPPPEQLEFRLG